MNSNLVVSLLVLVAIGVVYILRMEQINLLVWFGLVYLFNGGGV